LLVLTIVVVGMGASLLSAPNEPAGVQKAPVQSVQLVGAYPHDTSSFSQGLVVHKGQILEGTGHYNESRLRLVDIESGKLTMDKPLPSNVFGEGVTVYGTTALQLTWKSGFLFLYDVKTWQETGRVRYRDIDRSLAEGWGLTHDGKLLIISDGSSMLRFVDPQNGWKVVKRMYVKDGRRSVRNLNELEYVNGKIFANIWYKDQIAVIDPTSGQVEKYLDIAPLRPPSVRNNKEAALNGIAWEKSTNRLFVTGKNWPKIFEIKI